MQTTVSSSDHEDEDEVPMTSLSTDREPAYSRTSSQNDDVTTVMTVQPLPDDDIKQQGACYQFLSLVQHQQHKQALLVRAQ